MTSPARLIDAALDEEAAPLGLVCARVGAEIERAAGLAEQVEAAMGRLLQGGSPDEAAARDLQQLDLLRQTLESLAEVMKRVACATRAGARVDPRALVADVGLADLAGRLEGRPPGAAERAAAGELELF